jgi:hypothetical protein
MFVDAHLCIFIFLMERGMKEEMFCLGLGYE